MADALIAMESFLRAPSSLPTLARIALTHYQFEAIHPFRDGNGRVGRLLVTLLLVGEGLVRQPLLYLSAFFERRRTEYYQRLAAVSLHGEADEWIGFFLEGVQEQARDAVERSGRLFSLHRDYQRRLQTARGSALVTRLVELIFANPAISVTQAQRELGVTYRAAALHVARLVEEGILVEVTHRERNRVYVAPEVLRLLEADVNPEEGSAEVPDQPVLPLE
jgi:Fic family protein